MTRPAHSEKIPLFGSFVESLSRTIVPLLFDLFRIAAHRGCRLVGPRARGAEGQSGVGAVRLDETRNINRGN
jgi:hypothetical protein